MYDKLRTDYMSEKGKAKIHERLHDNTNIAGVLAYLLDEILYNAQPDGKNSTHLHWKDRDVFQVPTQLSTISKFKIEQLPEPIQKALNGNFTTGRILREIEAYLRAKAFEEGLS